MGFEFWGVSVGKVVSAQLQQAGLAKIRRADTNTASRLSLSGMLAVLLLGAVVGVASTTVDRGEFTAGLVILVVLGITVLALNRLAERTDKRLMAGDASYRAFFEHAIEGIFRTTPDGHYLDANSALGGNIRLSVARRLDERADQHRLAALCRSAPARGIQDPDADERSGEGFRLGDLPARRRDHLDFRKCARACAIGPAGWSATKAQWRTSRRNSRPNA